MDKEFSVSDIYFKHYMKLFLVTSICLFTSFLSCKKECCDIVVEPTIIENNGSIGNDSNSVLIGEIYQRADFSYVYNEEYELSYYVKYTINQEDIFGPGDSVNDILK